MMVGPFCISWPHRLKTCLLRIIRGFWNRGGWTGWVDILFVAHYPGYVSSQSPTRCITSFSFYNPWSLLKAVVYNYIFWNVKWKNLIRYHCRQPHLAANVPSRCRVYHGSKSSLHYFMFVYFFVYFVVVVVSFSMFLPQNVVIWR